MDPEKHAEYEQAMKKRAAKTTHPEAREWSRQFLQKMEARAASLGKPIPKTSHHFAPEAEATKEAGRSLVSQGQPPVRLDSNDPAAE